MPNRAVALRECLTLRSVDVDVKLIFVADALTGKFAAYGASELVEVSLFHIRRSRPTLMVAQNVGHDQHQSDRY
ncbi:MAG TPA: hypothetical protein VFA78_05450 [Chloroflexota bacterium]|nr:hypothetical protein [Chloroflexota bacterium]